MFCNYDSWFMIPLLPPIMYQLLPKLCRSIGFTRPGQRRQYQCFRYLSSDLQHPAVKRVLLLWIKLERGGHVLRIADSTKALAWLCLCWLRQRTSLEFVRLLFQKIFSLLKCLKAQADVIIFRFPSDDSRPDLHQLFSCQTLRNLRLS